MTTATRDLAVDREAVRKAARLLFERGEVIEVRALGVKRGDRDRPHVEAGYFDNGDAALAAIEEIAPHARGCYWTLHRLKPDLLARRANRMDRVGTGETTGDDHVVRLRHLLIDIDPQRLSGISATDDEHRAAQDTVKQITESLMAAGWREPLIIDTGNGAGIIYRIDQPPENAALIRRSLEALAARFNTPTVEVDTAVWNPSRLAKIPGTPVAKGDHTTERPHRRSAILSAPKRLETVSHDLLKSLATQAPAKPEPERHSPNRANGPSLDVLKFLSDAGIGVRHEAAYADGSLHRLKECPCCGSQGGNAYVIQFGNGALCAGCFESDCALDWQWLREHFEDVYRAQAPVSPNGRHPDERPDVADENTVHVVTFHTAAEVVASAPENTDSEVWTSAPIRRSRNGAP